MTYGMDYIFSGGVDSSHADCEDLMRSTGGWFFFWLWAKAKTVMPQNLGNLQMLLLARLKPKLFGFAVQPLKEHL